MSKVPPYKKAAPGELYPYENNARTHSAEQIEQIARSIQEFGFISPIIVDSENGIIAGHGRWEAAKLLNLDSVPVVEATHLTDDQKKAYILADNQLALNAGWDADLLRVELTALNDNDFDLSLLGFDDFELGNLLNDDDLAVGDTDDDALPALPKSAITQPGDVWLLGQHRLMCGEPLSIDAWDLLIVDNAADMAFLNVPQKNKAGALSELLQGVLGCLTAKLKEEAPGYVGFHWPHYAEIERALFEIGTDIKACIVWDRGLPKRCGGDYRTQHECLFYINGGPWYGRQRETDLWLLDRLDIEVTEGKNQKPVALYERALKNSSKRGDVLLSAFDDCGTAFIAAQKLGRRVYAMETTPVNCDRIIERYQNYTGKAAKLEQGGVTYDVKKG